MTIELIEDIFDAFADHLGIEVSYAVPVPYVRKINNRIRELNTFDEFKHYISTDPVLISASSIVKQVEKLMEGGEFHHVRDRIFIILVDDAVTDRTHIGSTIATWPITREEINKWEANYMKPTWN